MTDSEEVVRTKCEKDRMQNENVDGRRKCDFARLVTRTKEITAGRGVERENCLQ